ncbi:NAD(P)H-quinone oxidoreductase [bacterium]|uniref:NAD(P)H-quinone oxidoreductase n=1 Tax=uncultured Victivallis sp. TaxID=354118 RepID=UPI0025986D3A|nr:NAD(P)H-quinone oxidoreductase [uncultured Victivallis sp.]MBS5531070.1 NAD(P)H-quinone oxidoreductase [bacterium]
MNAMLIDAGGRLAKTVVPDPVRREGEVLIEVHAAAVNRADLMQCDGNYPPPPGWPEWPGLEVAGVVLETPDSSRFRPGDRVCALLGGGGYAEKIAVPEGMVLPAPDGLSMEEAAAVPEVFATSYLNFVIEAGMKAGDTVFVQAGASGLGIAAIQLAKCAGCRVVTTVGTPEKAAFVRALGADVVVNHRTDDLGAALDANPPDIVLDCVGGSEFGALFTKMAMRGRWIQIAALGGARSEISLDTVFRKNLRLIGSTLRSRTNEMKREVLRSLEREYWPKFASGAIRPVIFRVLPLEEAAGAHGILRRRENIGKVVLRVR